jgi:hypothetical protein
VKSEPGRGNRKQLRKKRCQNATTAADTEGPGESGIGVGQRCVGRAISWRWSQSPLWTSRKRDAESVPDEKSAQKRLGQPANGKDLPMRWAASKAFGCFLQLI